MAAALSLDNLFTLAMLVFLQAVLGFDNLLYISLESKRVEASKQQMVRRVGVALAIVLRIVLLFAVVKAIDRGTPMIYAPAIWQLVMLVIQHLPRLVMRRVGF